MIYWDVLRTRIVIFIFNYVYIYIVLTHVNEQVVDNAR